MTKGIRHRKATEPRQYHNCSTVKEVFYAIRNVSSKKNSFSDPKLK